MEKPVAFAAKYYLYDLYQPQEVTISNKEKCTPSEIKAEPDYIEGAGWRGGYSFKAFLATCYAYLGDISNVEGIQYLCHHYYLKNGALGGKQTSLRIKKLITS